MDAAKRESSLLEAQAVPDPHKTTANRKIIRFMNVSSRYVLGARCNFAALDEVKRWSKDSN